MFWLSETPEKESKGWGELFLRICVNVSLKIKDTQDIIDVYSAHFAVTSKTARVEEIKLILDTIEKKNHPSIVAGDFNANNKEECYKVISSKMKDAQSVAAQTEYGATYHGFKPDEHKDDLSIDFQFYTKNRFFIKSFDIIQDKKETEKGIIYCSDHYAILSEVVFK